jgi:hypothetical protein
MRIFIRYLAVALAAFLFLAILLPRWQTQQYPHSLGPQFSDKIRHDLQKPINEVEPEILLLGNSVIVNGLDGSQFESETGRRTLHFAFNGAASAYYYLILKNIIVPSQTPPRIVLLFFIDNWLTEPDLMVSGGPYLSIIDEVAGSNEQVLLKKAYLNSMDPLVSYLNSHVAFFGERQTLKQRLDNRVKYPLPDWMLGCGKTCLDSALDEAFYYEKMLPGVDYSESSRDVWSGAQWDFNARLEASFLPDILEVARQNGIQLVLVREKNSRFMSQAEETRDMRSYFNELQGYLQREGVPLLDFAHDPALTVEMFHDQMHLNLSARPIFTHLVAEGFLSLSLPK